jgi:hypothetical protein
VKAFFIAAGVAIVGFFAYMWYRSRGQQPILAGYAGGVLATAPPSAAPPIDPPSQGASTLLKIASAPKAIVCSAAAKYYTAGLAQPVCGSVIKVTNAIDASTVNGAKSILTNAAKGNITGTAKAIVEAPLNQVKSAWNSVTSIF